MVHNMVKDCQYSIYILSLQATSIPVHHSQRWNLRPRQILITGDELYSAVQLPNISFVTAYGTWC